MDTSEKGRVDSVLVGHYAVALGLKRAEPRASLGFLFLAVQLADILFFLLLLLGIERAGIVPGLEAGHLRLDFAPYSHGLLGVLVMSAITYGIFRRAGRRQGHRDGHGRTHDDTGKRYALVMAVAVFSHWVLDVIVHTPDMALVDGGLPKVGLGLWRSFTATYLLEGLMLLVGLGLYLRATESNTLLGRFGMTGVVVILLPFNIVNIYGQPPGPNSTIGMFAVPGLILYAVLAGIAFWLDRKRMPRADRHAYPLRS